MSGIGDRHSGTAGGALRVGGKSVSVEIRLGNDACNPSVQHTAWMLLNILCRLQRVVNLVRISCPAEIDAVPRMSPLIIDGQRLQQALKSGALAIGSSPQGFASVDLAGHEASDIVISVGFEFCADATFCAIGNGLCGGIFDRPVSGPDRYSETTIGPYIAACLAAGEVFRLVRLNDYVPERQLFLSAADYSHGRVPTWSDLKIENEIQSVLLVGIGAVGSALLHTLYPLRLQGVICLADNDEKGIEDTNLGRYVLFGWNSLGNPKASEAARLIQTEELSAVPHDGGFEYFFASRDRPQIVLSAVDKNTARHTLQEQYAPLYISASTHNLRAEVLRCGPPTLGACLSCFNPLERDQRTEDEIRLLLQERPEIAIKLCEQLHLDQHEVVTWIRERKCSETGDRLVDVLRTDDGSAPTFAVGFVSVLSGIFLATELLKSINHSAGVLNGERNRAVFQFCNPAALTNTSQFYPRDQQCTACSPENLASTIWNLRYTALH